MVTFNSIYNYHVMPRQGNSNTHILTYTIGFIQFRSTDRCWLLPHIYICATKDQNQNAIHFCSPCALINFENRAQTILMGSREGVRRKSILIKLVSYKQRMKNVLSAKTLKQLSGSILGVLNLFYFFTNGPLRLLFHSGVLFHSGGPH